MTDEVTPREVGSNDGLGQVPEREEFDLRDCATGYAYMEATDPAAPDDWTTEDVVKAFIAGYEMAKRQQRAEKPVAWIRHDWSGTGERHLTFDAPPEPRPVRDEVVNPIWTPLVPKQKA